MSFCDKKIEKLFLPKGMKEVFYFDDKPIAFENKRGSLSLRVRPNSKTFYLVFKRTRKTLGAWCPKNYSYETARREAVAIVEGKHREFADPEFNTFTELYEQFVIAKKAESRSASYLKSLAERWKCVPTEMKCMPIEMITRADAIDMRNNASTPSQGNKIIEVCSAVWNFSKWNVAGIEPLLMNIENPFSRLKNRHIKREKPYVPTELDIPKYWKAIEAVKESDYRSIFKLKVLTGMHFTEIANLRVNMIERDQYGAWIKMPVNYHKNSNYENGIEHRIYLHDKTFDLLPLHKEFLHGMKRPQALLFEGLDQTPYSRITIDRVWRLALEKAGLPHIWLSRFRHMLITLCRNKAYRGYIVDASLITGHCYTKGTAAKHYTDWDSREVRQDMFIAGYYYQDRVWDTALNGVEQNDVLSDLELVKIIKSEQNSNGLPQIS